MEKTTSKFRRFIQIISRTSEDRSRLMEEPTDLYEDMRQLNTLYEELCWPHDMPIEFIPDYDNNRIIIQAKNRGLDTKLSK